MSDPDDAEARSHALAADLRVLIGTLKRRLREQADPGDLTPSQISVLVRLERDGPMTTTNLARAEGMRPQSMGATISSLQELGHVHGQPDPADGRQTLLSLTPACREMILRGRAIREDWLFRTLRARLSPEEESQLAAAVALLKRLAEP